MRRIFKKYNELSLDINERILAGPTNMLFIKLGLLVFHCNKFVAEIVTRESKERTIKQLCHVANIIEVIEVGGLDISKVYYKLLEDILVMLFMCKVLQQENLSSKPAEEIFDHLIGSYANILILVKVEDYSPQQNKDKAKESYQRAKQYIVLYLMNLSCDKVKH